MFDGECPRKMSRHNIISEQQLAMEAKAHHQKWSERLDTLNDANKTTTEAIIDIQLDRAHNNASLTELKKDLMLEKIKCNQDLQELHFVNCSVENLKLLQNETTSSYSSSVGKEKFLKEYITFKDETISCLNKKLFEVRLAVAENEELIKELEREKLDLEIEKESIRALGPDTVSLMQNELAAFNFRNGQISSQFEDIKEELALLKTNWELCLKDHKLQKEKDSEFDIFIHGIWNKNSKQEIKKELASTQANVHLNLDELNKLKETILKLDLDQENITSQRRVNAGIMIKYEIELDNFKSNELNYEKQKIKQQARHEQKKKKIEDQLIKIHDSIAEKDDVILKLTEKLQNTQKLYNSNVANMVAKESDTEAILEESILKLEKKIHELRTQQKE